jgi:hypothetical protein
MASFRRRCSSSSSLGFLKTMQFALVTKRDFTCQDTYTLTAPIYASKGRYGTGAHFIHKVRLQRQMDLLDLP